MAFADIHENQADIIRTMPSDERRLYESFKFARIEACFDDRIFVAYAIDKDGGCDWHSKLTVLDLEGSSKDGITVALADEQGKIEVVGFAPQRVFDLNVFVHIPLQLNLNWSLHLETGVRSLLYGLRIVTRNASIKALPGVHYLETLNNFRAKFPNLTV